MPLARIAALENWVHADFQPDLTLVFDVPVGVAAARRSGRPGADRFESQDGDFFKRVRAQYMSRARQFPQRVRIIDADRTLDKIRVELEEIISSI